MYYYEPQYGNRYFMVQNVTHITCLNNVITTVKNTQEEKWKTLKISVNMSALYFETHFLNI